MTSTFKLKMLFTCQKLVFLYVLLFEYFVENCVQFTRVYCITVNVGGGRKNKNIFTIAIFFK